MNVIDDGMRRYYDARAAEYDDWWLGTGRFADRDRPGWDAEVDELIGVLEALPPARTLDVGCGTAFLTRHLAGDVTALDQSPRMVEIAAARLPGARVVQGDAVPLPFPDASFDRVVTGHFYGHLEPAQRERFVAEARRLAPELIVVDSAGSGEEWQERTLDDRTRWRVYKRWFTADVLLEELGGGRPLHDGRWFVAVAS